MSQPASQTSAASGSLELRRISVHLASSSLFLFVVVGEKSDSPSSQFVGKPIGDGGGGGKQNDSVHLFAGESPFKCDTRRELQAIDWRQLLRQVAATIKWLLGAERGTSTRGDNGHFWMSQQPPPIQSDTSKTHSEPHNTVQSESNEPFA